ncbi:MAG: hypothetical protein QOD86_2767 [Miltoncostaeaceae bacterium]|nr:hypothetical protein [Miltoncostaeaceae bacterium]
MENEPVGAGLSRGRFLTAGAAMAAGVATASTWAGPAAAARAGRPARRVPPMPIPGGLKVGPDTQIHVWAPGDPGVTLPFSKAPLGGLDVEPTTIGDFRGFAAAAYHVGRAIGGDGTVFDLETDMRLFRGSYVGADKKRHSGSFGFI